MKRSVWSVSDGRTTVEKVRDPTHPDFSHGMACALRLPNTLMTFSLDSVATSGTTVWMEGQLEAALPQETWKYAQACARVSKSFFKSIESRTTAVNTSALSAAVALELSGESCLALSLSLSPARDSHFPSDKGSRSRRSHRNTFFCGRRPIHSFVAQSHRITRAPSRAGKVTPPSSS